MTAVVGRDVFVPTPEQRAAILHPATPLLLLAGAGTGKTTVVAERMAHLISSGQVRPEEVLALTFTNKAALELKQRVRRTVGDQADITVSTYHGFSARLVADHGLELDLHPRTQLLNRAQAWQLLFTVFDDFRFVKRKTFRPDLIVTDALVLAARCADHLVEVEAVEADCKAIIEGGRWQRSTEAATGRHELCQVVAAYERRKRERHLLDYGDQIRLAVRLLEQEPVIASDLRAQHPVVLLDEYQDTNYAQRVLLQAIYPPGSAVTAVGDDMQSIYAFRGAHLENILDFDSHFPPVTRLPLTVNRRSGPELVQLANRIQQQVSRTHEKELRALDEAPATAIECFLAADDTEEAMEIARDIRQLGPPWKERAVLCRKRRLIPAVVAALEGFNVPVEVIGSSGLLDRPEVVDLMAWLELLADPGASIALLRLLTGPRYRIGWRDLAVLARRGRQRATEAAEAKGRPDPHATFALSDTLLELDALPDLSGEARARLARFVVEWQELATAAARLPVLDLAETVISRTGLWAIASGPGRENLLRFLDVAERFDPVEGEPGLADFVEYIQLLDEAEEDLDEAHLSADDAVPVMTVHQAKGLEFDAVWIPGLSRGIFPDSRGGENPIGAAKALPWWLTANEAGLPSINQANTMKEIDEIVRGRHLDEEWRLLYVACTRARQRLVISAAQWYPGTATPFGPSRFYTFIAAQNDLVLERYHHEPAQVHPQVAAMERRRAEADKRLAEAVALAPKAGGPPTLFEEPAPVPVARAPRAAPTTVSVTNLVSYARCPRQFYWSAVRPLPRAGSAGARLGTEVHRWIELRASRQLVLIEPEPEAGVDRDPGDTEAGAGGRFDALTESFLASPYATLDPEQVEAPFVLAVGGRLVRGRIDAVYRREGRLELVDFKTGRRPAAGDGGAQTQLDLYAIAAVDTWGAAAIELRTTYCYLGASGPEQLVSTDWDDQRLAEARADLDRHLAAIAAGSFPTASGPWCAGCEFLTYCPAGQAVVQSGP